MKRAELNHIIEALERAHDDTQNTTNRPTDTVSAFVAEVGYETAVNCITAMTLQASWDGRISRAAKEWAASVELPEEWSARAPEIGSDRIHKAHLSQIAEAMAAYSPEPETENNASAETIISAARASLEAEKQRSAWNRGVTVYALELLEDLETGVIGGYFSMDDMKSPKLLEQAMLNGADDWGRYSWGGSALVYNSDIAARLCTPSELKRTREGWRRPNSREDWLDVQARALCQAARRVKRHISDAVKEAKA